jgi:hypothetical protein
VPEVPESRGSRCARCGYTFRPAGREGYCSSTCAAAEGMYEPYGALERFARQNRGRATIGR